MVNVLRTSIRDRIQRTRKLVASRNSLSINKSGIDDDREKEEQAKDTSTHSAACNGQKSGQRLFDRGLITPYRHPLSDTNNVMQTTIFPRIANRLKIRSSIFFVWWYTPHLITRRRISIHFYISMNITEDTERK